jgi:hypothetical protein
MQLSWENFDGHLKKIIKKIKLFCCLRNFEIITTDIDLIYSTTAKTRACVFVGYGLV